MESRLQAELNELKLEISRLRERLSLGTPTVHKDLSPISLIPKWSGSETAIPLEDFIDNIESAARIGRWQEKDNFDIAVLKLTDSAKLLYQGCVVILAFSACSSKQQFSKVFPASEIWDVFLFRHVNFTVVYCAIHLSEYSPDEFIKV